MWKVFENMWFSVIVISIYIWKLVHFSFGRVLWSRFILVISILRASVNLCSRLMSRPRLWFARLCESCSALQTFTSLWWRLASLLQFVEPPRGFIKMVIYWWLNGNFPHEITNHHGITSKMWVTFAFWRAVKPMRARRLSQRRPVVLLCDLDSGESSWLWKVIQPLWL